MPRTSAESGLLALASELAVPDSHFDELLDRQGELRPAWAAFSAHAGYLSADHLARAQARVDRQLQENGVTYNVYASVDGLPRPWTLDVLPLLIPGEEWVAFVHGLQQRARLLNAVAADLYGERHLLRERLLPPDLVLQHPGFLRACDAAQPAGGVFLHLLAFDLVRAADGQWVVLDTRTQAPSGAGYALENRAAISRLFPEPFRTLDVQPLGGFFHELRETLIDGAPAAGGDTPYVVLLTPGPYNETYFEHAYLAKQLGFPLVEGGDLTVRRERVFLKTVSGLRPVHGILRRLDDDYCDPLELRSDSTLGVPGLVQAWRAGQVLVANAFGTGVLESRVLSPWLPAICERLFGEPLASLAPESPTLSHAPVWQHGALTTRGVILRVFLATDGQGSYRVMPGGLTRIASDDGETVSGQRGSGSKDTWVLPAPATDFAQAGEGRVIHREELDPNHGATSSRAAEHLFWLGRYAERSENCARLLRAVLSRLTDADALPRRLRPVVLTLCREHGLLQGEAQTPDQPLLPDRLTDTIEQALVSGMLDTKMHQSLAFNILQTVRVAGAARDRLSLDNWRLLNRLQQHIAHSAESHVGLDEALEIVDQSIIMLVAVGGLEMAHMTRDDGWRFLSIGRHLERLTFIASTLKGVAGWRIAMEPALLEWLLDLSDSLVGYRVRFMHHPEWPRVVDLLLLDPHNPRSGMFQLAKLAKNVSLLPGTPTSELADIVGDIEALLSAAVPADRAQGELFGHASNVDALLRTSQSLAGRLSDALTLRYFSHVYDVPRATLG